MTGSILATLSSLASGVSRGVIRGLAVVVLLAVCAVSNLATSVGTYLGVAGISTLALTMTSTPADAGYRRRWRRRRWWR